MASSVKHYFFFFFFSVHLLLLSGAFLAKPVKKNLKNRCGFDTIYQLGDSIADTGNLIQENPSSFLARFPYGQTYFKKPTGRCSDGLLIVDYIAMSAGIPFVDAYLNPNATFGRGRGVNFAVAGSTALPVEVLAQKRIKASITKTSLNLQLDWMFTYFNGICFNDKDCANKLSSSLFIVGEIGGNDYNYALFQGKSMEEVKTMVPDVVEAIKDAIQKVIAYGGRRILVPGNFPIGCFPIYLTKFKTNYDEFHCLKELNDLSVLHNQYLQQAIEELKKEYANVTLVYADYYEAYRRILRLAPDLGFDVRSLTKACCGSGGDYNFNLWRMCGSANVSACAEPNRYISWDGINLTQEAYKHIAKMLILDRKIKGLFTPY